MYNWILLLAVLFLYVFFFLMFLLNKKSVLWVVAAVAIVEFIAQLQAGCQ